MIRIRHRSRTQPLWTAAVYGAAAFLAVLSILGLVYASGAPVGEAIASLVSGAVGSPAALLSSLVSATPLILAGLSTVVAYRAGVWNIGQEGQVLAGGMAAYQASLFMAGAPPFLAITVCMCAGLAGGMTLGAMAAWLKSRFAVSEIVSTVMLNYLAAYLLSYLLANVWTATGGSVSYQQTPMLAEALWLPVLASGSKLHLGFLIAIAAVVLLHVLLKRTALGYEIRALGENPEALRQRGTNTVRTTLVVMGLSGALAASAGFGEVFGMTHRLTTDNLAGIGFDGIIIGMIGNLTPVGTLIAALFFGALHSGALFMNVMTGVPASLITALQGLILLLFLMAGVASRFEISWERARGMV